MDGAGLPLENVTVIDCSSIIAGPLVGTIMGEFGADVIKIENPDGGDPIRHHGDYDPELLWKLLGRNKKSVAIDLREPEGQQLVKEMTEDVDVFVENFRPGTLESWGLGWETLSAINPRLVMVRVTGFGQTGPYKDKPGFGTLAEAMSGLAYRTGEPDGPPMLPPLGLGDTISGLYSTFATMIALYWRDTADGTGQYIDSSILEHVFAAAMDFQVPEYSEEGIVRERMGNRVPQTAPRNTYKTKDGRWVAIASSAESIAERILRIVGGEDLVEDSRFASMKTRTENVDELDAIIQDWMAQHTRAEVIDIFDEQDAAVGPVYNIEDIFTDSHFRAREALVDVPDETLGTITLPGVFPKLSETPGKISHAGPPLGAHTTDILRQFTTISETDIQDLSDRGIIKEG